MRLKKSDVKEKINKIKKQVEDISELKMSDNPFNVELTNRLIESFDDFLDGGNFFKSYLEKCLTNGGFSTTEGDDYSLEIYSFPKYFFGNEDYLNCTIGHELMHGFQKYNFPNLFSRSFLHKAHETKYSNAYKRLIEGDALFVEKTLAKNFYPNTEFNYPAIFDVISSLYYEKYREENKETYNIYGKGFKILMKDFEGNRKEINKLYSLDEFDLYKIFG